MIVYAFYELVASKRRNPCSSRSTVPIGSRRYLYHNPVDWHTLKRTEACQDCIPLSSRYLEHDRHKRACRYSVQCCRFRPRQWLPLCTTRLDYRSCSKRFEHPRLRSRTYGCTNSTLRCRRKEVIAQDRLAPHDAVLHHVPVKEHRCRQCLQCPSHEQRQSEQ